MFSLIKHYEETLVTYFTFHNDLWAEHTLQEPALSSSDFAFPLQPILLHEFYIH